MCIRDSIDAFQAILDKGIFGYTDLSDRFYEYIREWMRQKHQAEVAREEIVFCPRINVSSSICVETFTEEMDEVIINTPAYGPLYQAVVKNHRKVVEDVYKRQGLERCFEILFVKVKIFRFKM